MRPLLSNSLTHWLRNPLFTCKSRLCPILINGNYILSKSALVHSSNKSLFFSPPDFLKNPFSSKKPNPSKSSEVLSYQQQRILSFSPKQVYDVVSDVDSYSKFVPWCTGSKVDSKINIGNESQLQATLSIGFTNFSESYTSNVLCRPPNLVEARNGNSSLFKELISRWKIKPHPSSGGCEVKFEIEFQLNSSLYASLSQLYFQQVSTAMVEAFEQRCKTLYGQR